MSWVEMASEKWLRVDIKEGIELGNGYRLKTKTNHKLRSFQKRQIRHGNTCEVEKSSGIAVV
jgi:hypothetical protein